MEIHFQQRTWQKVPSSSCRDVTAAATAAKANIIPICFTKSLILLKQLKNLLQVKKLSKMSIFMLFFERQSEKVPAN